jgi:SAM-dependent methyltransferase
VDSKLKAIINHQSAEQRINEFKVIENNCNVDDFQNMYLEVGCGKLGLMTLKDRLIEFQTNSFGIDIDLDSLYQNNQVRHRICADCNLLPFKELTFDIIVCRWVFEHIQEPEILVSELSRVLKDKGYLFFTTPNLLNYLMLLSKLSPLTLHNFVRNLLGSSSNIRTYYRINTTWKIRKLALKYGFKIKHIEIEPHGFMYFAFNKYIFLLLRSISRSISKYTSAFNLKILCLLQKDSTSITPR